MTIKELCKKSSRQIKRMQREFNREKRKLVSNNKKIQRQIKNMLKKGEPRTNIRIVAAGLAKNNNHIKRYGRLDA
jgi:predicted transcriptional regulator